MSVQTNKAPRFQDLTELVTEVLAANSYFTTLSAAAVFSDTESTARPRTVVIKDTGTTSRKNLIAKRLRECGVAIVVCPLQGGENREKQVGFICDNLLLVKVRTNPDNFTGDVYEVVGKVVNTLTRSARHPGGEFFKFVEYLLIASEDDGELGYALMFSKETVE